MDGTRPPGVGSLAEELRKQLSAKRNRTSPDNAKESQGLDASADDSAAAPPPPPRFGLVPTAASGIPPPPPPPGLGRDSFLGSNPGSARSSFLLGANLSAARKDMPITPNQKMKQLQWDKLPHQQVTNTLWQDEEPTKEKEMIAKLSSDGIWSEMEADFQAKQLVINLLGVLPSPKVASAFSLIALRRH